MKAILIVDYDPIMLQTLSGLLRSQGGFLEILTADNGQGALGIIAEKNVQIVITGLHLPEMDGLELLTQISKQYPEIRVIVMTANASPMFQSKH